MGIYIKWESRTQEKPSGHKPTSYSYVHKITGDYKFILQHAQIQDSWIKTNQTQSTENVRAKFCPGNVEVLGGYSVILETFSYLVVI